MDEQKFSLRQKWFPNFDDAANMLEARGKDSLNFPIRDFLGRWARSIVLGFTLLEATCQTVGNNIQYSQGERVGVINKISEKGLIWKTYEGQLSLEGRTSTGDYTGAGVWNFSLDRQGRHGENIDSLHSKISQYMEEGKRVKITYKEPLATWPWRSETDYLIQSVKDLGLAKESEKK